MVEALQTLATLQTQQPQPKPDLPRPLQEAVHDALEARFGDRVAGIILQENRDKYYNRTAPKRSDAQLAEVFGLMRGLNQEAINAPDLGRRDGHGKSFIEAFNGALAQVARQAAGRPLHYVELGPEPAKTGHAIATLQKLGVEIASYTGVDINPASEPEMRAALSAYLPPDRIGYHTCAFEDFRTAHVAPNGAAVLVTMMGFQEGNEDPATHHAWFEAMTRPGEMLISEMQLSGIEGDSRVVSFYDHPKMRRFSRIAFERAIGELDSHYRQDLIPVILSDGREVPVMVLSEVFRAPDDNRDTILVTNYCIKYALDDFRHYRKASGAFAIMHESLTGDETIVFQLAQRR